MSATSDYQQAARGVLEAARAQYRVQRKTLVVGRATPDPGAAGLDAAHYARLTDDAIARRELELEQILAGLDEVDARWLLSLIRARFGRVEATTREQWVRAKR